MLGPLSFIHCAGKSSEVGFGRDHVSVDRLRTLLFNMLLCTNIDNGYYLRPGHDYGGAAEFRMRAGDPMDAMIHAGYPYVAAVPAGFVTVWTIFGSVCNLPLHS